MNATFEQRDGHGKSRNYHGELMEKSWGKIAKSVGTLIME